MFVGGGGIEGGIEGEMWLCLYVYGVADLNPFPTPPSFPFAFAALTQKKLDLMYISFPPPFLPSFPSSFLQVCGVPVDQRTETTHVVEDDGLHPCWDSTFTFPIQAPEHALVSLTVRAKDVGKADDFITTAVLPVSCLRPGFRKVQLGNISGNKGADYEFCSLFVFVHMDA